jgi:hypothetical protein
VCEWVDGRPCMLRRSVHDCMRLATWRCAHLLLSCTISHYWQRVMATT